MLTELLTSMVLLYARLGWLSFNAAAMQKANTKLLDIFAKCSKIQLFTASWHHLFTIFT